MRLGRDAKIYASHARVRLTRFARWKQDHAGVPRIAKSDLEKNRLFCSLVGHQFIIPEKKKTPVRRRCCELLLTIAKFYQNHEIQQAKSYTRSSSSPPLSGTDIFFLLQPKRKVCSHSQINKIT